MANDGKLYTDFDLSFTLNANGDVASFTDEDCIRAAIKNSINFESFDIPFNQYYAPNIKYYLFDQHNKIMASDLKRNLIEVLNLDPRFSNPSVDVNYQDINGIYFCIIDITVYVSMLNKDITEQIRFERVR